MLSAIAAPPFKATFSLDGVSNISYLGYEPDVNWGLWDIPVDLPIIPVSFDITDPAQACNPLPDNTPNLSGAITLIRRGTCNFAVKQANAARFGAELILFYDNENPLTNPGSVDPAIPAAGRSRPRLARPSLLPSKLAAMSLPTLLSRKTQTGLLGFTTQLEAFHPSTPAGVGLLS